jgi:exonuclease SbcD
MEQVRRRFPHTLSLQFDPQGAPVPVSTYAARVAARSEVDVCCDFLAHVRSGHEATEAEREVVAGAVEAARLARAGRDDEGAAAVPPAGRREGAA